MTTRKNTLSATKYLALVVFSLFIALPDSPLLAGPGIDQEVFKYAGMALDLGARPYTDIFDHKPPLIYLITAFSDNFGIWGFWLFERIAVGLTAIAFYTWLKNNKFPARFGLALAFLIFLDFPGISGGGGMTRTFTGCTNFLTFLVISSSLRRKYFYAGILLGLTFMLQQNEVLPAIAWLGGWWLLRKDLDIAGLVKRTGLLFLGSLVPVVPILLFVLAKGAFSDFVEQAFLFNFEYIQSDDSLYERVIIVLKGCILMGLAPALLFLAVAIGSTYFYHLKYLNKSEGGGFKSSRLLWCCALALLFQFITASVSGKFYGHYFIGVLPILVLIFAISLKEIDGFQISRFVTPVVLVVFLATAIPSDFYFKAFDSSVQAVSQFAKEPVYEASNDDYVAYLKPLEGQTGQLFIFRNTSQLHLNTYFKIVSPTKYIYTHLYNMIPGWDTDGTLFTQLIEDVKSKKTFYILDYSSISPIRPDLQLKWDSFISANYDQVRLMPDGGILFKIKEGQKLQVAVR
ncbi:MAG: hypothetical protein J0I20_24380 [Chloroflexi bacterium]|nr:hypothetical protein [Chloroflexota bacterium]OJW03472.1 MAG: hypothetical protein BGO39_10740 [Chloroflexi bacterium 54-19]